jgi:hypothetical protein
MRMKKARPGNVQKHKNYYEGVLLIISIYVQSLFQKFHVKKIGRVEICRPKCGMQ